MRKRKQRNNKHLAVRYQLRDAVQVAKQAHAVSAGARRSVHELRCDVEYFRGVQQRRMQGLELMLQAAQERADRAHYDLLTAQNNDGERFKQLEATLRTLNAEVEAFKQGRMHRRIVMVVCSVLVVIGSALYVLT